MLIVQVATEHEIFLTSWCMLWQQSSLTVPGTDTGPESVSQQSLFHTSKFDLSHTKLSAHGSVIHAQQQQQLWECWLCT